jgi:hypothetical protein
MAGFSEGFAQGFGLVDAALQRRRANENYEQRMATDDARYRDEMARQQMLDQRNEDHYNNELAAQQQAAKFEQEKYRHQLVKDDREFGLKEADQFSNNAYRQAQLENQNKQLGIQEMQARSAVDENQAQTEKVRLETQWAKEQKNRQDAMMRVQANLIKQDQATGLTTIHLTKGNEQNDLNDIQTALGVNVGRISSDLQAFNQDLTNIKSALADPRYFQQNKQAVLQSFNNLEAHDINKGLGPYDGDNPDLKGGEVVKKEISDVYPSPDGKGFVFNVRTVVNKGGKEIIDEGPMTQYRSSSPADNQIRVIGIPEIIRRLEGYDAIGQVLQANPDFVSAVNRVAGQSKKEKGDYQPVIEENYNTETMANEKRYVGAFNKDTGEITRTGQATQPAKSSPDEQRRKAEYVLNNRSKFKDRPDIIQAAEAAMRSE